MSRFILVDDSEREFLLNVDFVSVVRISSETSLTLETPKSTIHAFYEDKSQMLGQLADIYRAHNDWIELSSDWKPAIGRQLPEKAVLVDRRKVLSVTKERDMDILWILRFWTAEGSYAIKSFPGNDGQERATEFMQRVLKG